ncbi:hypothetical protein LX36DRAFT_715994 [Colletotrichum falcatum]|nr:hypothetical protein LX36DRAFT_715994 [Colletotrichum falcatum]
MGRWGYRLLEGYLDLDLASDVDDVAVARDGSEDIRLSHTIVAIRHRPGSGLGDMIFDKHRAKENEFCGDYRVIIGQKGPTNNTPALPEFS